MAENLQEKEFVVFGFISKQLRSGFILGTMIILLSAIVVLFKINVDTNDKLVLSEAQKQELTERLMNQMLDRVDQKVNEKLDPQVQMIRASVKKVNDSANKVDSVAERAGNLTNSIKRKFKKS